MRKELPHVLFFAPEVTLGYNEIYFSVADRARELGAQWIFRATDDRPEHHRFAKQFAADLVISTVPVESLPDFLDGLPVVSLGSTASDSGDIRIDESAIGRESVRHLQGCGYRDLAFLGRKRNPLTEERLRAFRQTAKEAGLRVHALKLDYSPAPWLRTNPNPESGRRLRKWLRELPKPVGLSCMSSMQAMGVEMMCFELGFKVPDAVGILGVGGRSEQIASIKPGISVITLPLGEIGRALADAAHALLTKKPRLRPRVFGPDSVLERGSTEIQYASDPLVAQSIRFIDEALHQPLRVSDLAQRAGVSRSGFEQRFRAATGRSPLAEIHRQRIERAQRLLGESGMAVKQVADACGVGDPYQFSTFFKKHTGVSPRDFREGLTEAPPGPRGRKGRSGGRRKA